ncbi:NRDE family protein [Thalassotalea sp. LPB0316]|uniref:NRDE family protein n=1 Tax=Thalassotalea sp. LPB0316 TaxID=2769490 RepID=UPI001865E52D|nr:NRDE family protein [Thalassotalea sp. LPB0316]QOL25961.1 NRDE family protein [Thalassotalea sp. LPB0316]
MCILFIAVNSHPNYPLIIAANRDEFHTRPTQAMSWWQERELLAGKDLQADGTWLAIRANGFLSALTNFRELPLKTGEFKSRGELPLLALEKTEQEVKAHLIKHSNAYQGFNLLFGNHQNLICFDSSKKQFTPLSQGFHSICNGSLDDKWPKMARGEQALEAYVNQHQEINHQALFDLLTDQQQAPDELLPETGIGLEWERTLSSIMIIGKEYGTRSSCVYTLSRQGHIAVSERTFSPTGECLNSLTFNWQIDINNS